MASSPPRRTPLDIARTTLATKAALHEAASKAYNDNPTPLLDLALKVAQADYEVALCQEQVELIRTPQGKEVRLTEARAKVEEIRKRPDSDAKKERDLQRAEEKVEKIEDEDEEEAKLEKAEAKLEKAKAELEKAKVELEKAEAKLKEGGAQAALQTAPLTDALLHYVQFQEPSPPNMLHPLKPYKLITSLPGDMISYVDPPSFDAAYGFLTSAVTTSDLGRNYIKLFVDGPSGSGKTRFVWELYRRLKTQLATGNSGLYIDAVSYVFINLTNSFFSPTSIRDDVEVQKHLAKYIILQLGAPQKYFGINVSLHGVLKHLFGGKRGALVLHIDEFHRNPEEAIWLLSVVRRFSEEPSAAAVILPVCSGLYTHPSFDPAKVSSVVERVPLGYFRDHQKTWEIVRGAGLAVADPKTTLIYLAEKDLTKAPQVLQYLIEDIAGWPMAAVQLGVNIVSLWDAQLSGAAHELAGVEDAVVAKLKEVYPVSKLSESFGGSSEEALFKVATLALSPFPVREDEPINGITMKDIRKYGVVDDQKVEDEESKNYGKSFIRISKPLLRIIVDKLHVLEKILTGGHTVLPAGLLPDRINLCDLLRTCRRYDADTQETVELVSQLVAIHAWLLIEDRPDAKKPTLSTLRPGAKVLGSKVTASQELTFLTAAAAAVDAAGDGKDGKRRTEARHKVALENTVLLVERTKMPEKCGTAALSKVCGAGYDMVVKVGGVVQYGQTKGREAGPAAGAGGGDSEVTPAQLSTFLEDLQAEALAAVTPGAPTSECQMEPAHIHLELLCAGKASKGVSQILAGDTSNKTYGKIVRMLGPHSCALVMMRAELEEALGIVFGGIAAR